jgi:hypothetical protein
MAIAIDGCVDHSKAIIAKSFRYGGETTSQNPAQGGAWEIVINQGGRWEVQRVKESAPWAQACE